MVNAFIFFRKLKSCFYITLFIPVRRPASDKTHPPPPGGGRAVVNELVRAIKAHHIARLQAGSCSIEYGFVLDDLLTNYERVCDHCSNVAVAQIEVAQDSFDTHAYLNELRHGNDTKESEEFHRRLDRYRERYLFPENQSAEDFDK